MPRHSTARALSLSRSVISALRAGAMGSPRHGPGLLAEEFALRPREERLEDETGRHPQASARLALESLDGLLARLPLVWGWAVSSPSCQLLHEQRHRLAQELDLIRGDAARFQVEVTEGAIGRAIRVYEQLTVVGLDHAGIRQVGKTGIC